MMLTNPWGEKALIHFRRHWCILVPWIQSLPPSSTSCRSSKAASYSWGDSDYSVLSITRWHDFLTSCSPIALKTMCDMNPRVSSFVKLRPSGALNQWGPQKAFTGANTEDFALLCIHKLYKCQAITDMKKKEDISPLSTFVLYYKN